MVRTRGTTLSVASANGTATTVTVPQSARIERATLLPAASLTPGTRVGLRGTDNPDGTVTAVLIMVEGKGRR